MNWLVFLKLIYYSELRSDFKDTFIRFVNKALSGKILKIDRDYMACGIGITLHKNQQQTKIRPITIACCYRRLFGRWINK